MAVPSKRRVVEVSRLGSSLLTHESVRGKVPLDAPKNQTLRRLVGIRDQVRGTGLGREHLRLVPRLPDERAGVTRGVDGDALRLRRETVEVRRRGRHIYLQIRVGEKESLG